MVREQLVVLEELQSEDWWQEYKSSTPKTAQPRYPTSA
jgi:hypothetical protein